MSDEIKLEDALQNLNITSLTNKNFNNEISYNNPVNVLQEYLVKRGYSQPIYSFDHDPSSSRFISTVTYKGPHVAIGTGQNKKQAKHSAAAELMAQLKSNVLEETYSSNLNNQISHYPDFSRSSSCSDEKMHFSELDHDYNKNLYLDKKPKDDIFVTNTIGELQEYCLAKKWDYPIYELTSETGVPHDKIFAIQCQVKPFNAEVVGYGKTKKDAKHKAATNMILYLKKFKNDFKLEKM